MGLQLTHRLFVPEPERTGQKIFDIRERAFAFAVRTVKLCRDMEKKVSRTLTYQLLKAGTSIGADLEEVHAGQSNPTLSARMR